MRISDWDSENLIDDFINTRVIRRGLDRRTEKAYRMDLEQFYIWARGNKDAAPGMGKRDGALSVLSCPGEVFAPLYHLQET